MIVLKMLTNIAGSYMFNDLSTISNLTVYQNYEGDIC